MKHTWPSVEDKEEYVKNQGAQTAFAWDGLSAEEKQTIQSVSVALFANLEALAFGVSAEVESNTKGS